MTFGTSLVHEKPDSYEADGSSTLQDSDLIAKYSPTRLYERD